MESPSWAERFEAEIRQAEAARAAGNEGKARVCARRAAGLAAGAYFDRLGLASPGLSAFDFLRALCILPHPPTGVKEIAGHFLLRVTTEHTLPLEADLIQEARILRFKLFPAGE